MEGFLVDSKSAGSRCEEVAVLNKFTLLPSRFSTITQTTLYSSSPLPLSIGQQEIHTKASAII
jgi:hypothetical protein